MKKNLIFTFFSVLLLTLSLLASGCTLPVSESNDQSLLLNEQIDSSAAYSGSNVRLVYALPFNYAVSGMSWDLVYFYVHTKNIGTPASRVVSIYWKNGSVWTTTPMTLVTAYGDHSYYKLDTLGGSTKEFVVKYESSAGTYWDNNGGLNYKVKPWTSSGGFITGAVGGNVALSEANVTDYAYFTGTGWSTAPKVKVTFNIENLSYNKSVKVRYTVNNGATWADANASYTYTTSTGGGYIEYWTADVYTPAGTSSSGNIRFALVYKNLDTGIEYWDNNFFQDYTVGLTYGTVVR